MNKLKSYFGRPENLILVILMVLLSLLTLVPLLSLIRDTFVVHPAELFAIPNTPIGGITLYHWQKVFFDGDNSVSIFYRPFMNTMMVSFGSVAIAILLGGLFAWLVTRTNIKYKPFISVVFIFPYIMPSWTLAMAWLNFFRNSRVGGAPGIFTAMTGILTPDWFAYGLFPIVIVLGLHYAPFAYILIGGILKNMDANLEEAAVILGTSRKRIVQKITLPIVLPALLSTFLLVFASTMSSFAVPGFLGTPVRFQVITTQMYRTLNGLNPGYGFLIALVMIFLGVSILLLNQRIVGKRRSFTTITGKSSQISFIDLKRWRGLISNLVIVFLFTISLLPLLTFALESFIMIPGRYTFDNLSTVFWIGDGSTEIGSGEPGILRNATIFMTMWNSFRLSTVASIIAGSIGVLAGYSIVKKRGTKLATFVNNLAFFPYLMPAMAFGAIYLSMFTRQNLFLPSLYGTFAILVLIGSVKYLPFASRAGINAMLQLGPEIEEAAVILGIPWWKRMVQIIFPIQKASFLSGYLLPFISIMRELSLFILLVSPSTRVLTTLLFQYNEKGWYQYANAINLFIIAVVLIVTTLVNKLTGASIDKGIGG